MKNRNFARSISIIKSTFKEFNLVEFTYLSTTIRPRSTTLEVIVSQIPFKEINWEVVQILIFELATATAALEYVIAAPWIFFFISPKSCDGTLSCNKHEKSENIDIPWFTSVLFSTKVAQWIFTFHINDLTALGRVFNSHRGSFTRADRYPVMRLCRIT